MAPAIAAICGAAMVAVCLTGCGPRKEHDYPDVSTQDWATAEIDYWYLNSQRERVKRVVEIREPEVLRDLFKALQPYETESAYFRAGNRIRLTTRDGAAWHATLVFEDRIDFTQIDPQDPKGYVKHQFHVHPKNNEFYKALKRHCLKDLQRMFPTANIGHVIIRSNLSDTHRPSIDG